MRQQLDVCRKIGLPTNLRSVPTGRAGLLMFRKVMQRRLDVFRVKSASRWSALLRYFSEGL